MSTNSPERFLRISPVDSVEFALMRGGHCWFAGFGRLVGVRGHPDFVNGGDDRIRPLKRDHVCAIRNHDSPAPRGKMGFLHLQIIHPYLVKVVELLFWKTNRQL